MHSAVSHASQWNTLAETVIPVREDGSMVRLPRVVTNLDACAVGEASPLAFVASIRDFVSMRLNPSRGRCGAVVQVQYRRPARKPK